MRHTETQELTTTKATSQAAGRVRRLMPGAMVNIVSRGSWDLATDTHLVITSVMYPPAHPAAVDARAALRTLPGVRSVECGTGYMTVTRER